MVLTRRVSGHKLVLNNKRGGAAVALGAAETLGSGRGAVEQRLRRDLAAAYRLFAVFGWDDLLFTHLSVRIPGPEHHFLLNPFGLTFEEVTASSLVKVDLEGRIVEPTDYLINPAGFTIHSAVHAAREDAQCVMHIHTIAGTGVSCQEHGLLPIHQEAMLIQEQIGYHNYEGVAFNHDERPRLVRDLAANNYLILRNHGTMTLGRTVPEAFSRMYHLERACQMQIAALAGGARVITPSEDIQAVTKEQGRADQARVANDYIWPAMLRRLERHGADYDR
ncbi:MAG: class II aldolase/adducin family protein [Hyphomonadaceae bacterium]|nr:class II aldolase/adducin family protein [Hyphomonadaceae bacterium]